jgi:hypothetical protein
MARLGPQHPKGEKHTHFSTDVNSHHYVRKYIVFKF